MDMVFITMVAIFMILVIVMGTLVAVSQDIRIRDDCRKNCEKLGCGFEGMSGGKCVCRTSNITGSYIYVEISDN